MHTSESTNYPCTFRNDTGEELLENLVANLTHFYRDAKFMAERIAEQRKESDRDRGLYGTAVGRSLIPPMHVYAKLTAHRPTGLDTEQLRAEMLRIMKEGMQEALGLRSSKRSREETESEAGSVRSVSASVLAKGTRWLKWPSAVGVCVYRIIPEDKQFIDKGVINYPYELPVWASNQKMEPNLSSLRTFLADLQRQWTATSVFRKLTTPSDNHLAAILLMWSMLEDTREETNRNEASQRLPVDVLLHYVFVSTESQSILDADERKFALCLEEQIALPQPRMKTDEKDDFPSSAIVDALVVAWISGSMDREVFSSNPEIEVDLKYRPTTFAPHYLGVFPVEDKCADKEQAQRQLCMNLAAIQRHRKALCLQERDVYGAVFIAGHLSLYISWWKDETIEIAPVAALDWDLKSARGFVECFYYLSNFKEQVRGEIDADLTSFEIKNMLTDQARTSRSKWRLHPSDRPRGQSRGSPDAKRRKQSGGLHEDCSSVNSVDEELPTPEQTFSFPEVDLVDSVEKVANWIERVRQDVTEDRFGISEHDQNTPVIASSS
ncbi:hypothetical protein EIP91_002573 [Steccherinum ochraceum]|uniref:Uncharacterized protein n=1 Tax=Steccherinum ochraceum TaxID=92696 RepID=A0A4R0RKD8_9APHY|nr:hypothetical protein EIP91_002573 [Steccherinum ochraceum]